MSTSENKPDLPAETNAAPPASGSERAKAIARRSFLRKSAGIAAPVVMTLQSGPALAIRSITCQDKTGTLNVEFPSGFTGTDETIPSGSNDAQVIPVLSTAPNATIMGVDTLDTDPADPNAPATIHLQRIPANDGIVRCTNTSVTLDTVVNPATFNQFGQEWRFQGPDGTFDPGTSQTDIGPIAMFSIDADGDKLFEGCYGNGSENLIGGNGEATRPLTCSCWSSLNP